MKNKIWIIVITALVAVLIPIVLDKLVFASAFFGNVSNDGWAGFFGGYTGGIATLLAVFFTIKDNAKNIKEQREIDEEKEDERIRISVMPYLQTAYDFFDENAKLEMFDFICMIDEVEIKTRFSRSELEKIEHFKNSNEYCFLRYSIRNVGMGNAIELKIEINGNDYKTEFALPKNEMINIFLWSKLGNLNKRSIAINLSYWDTLKKCHYCRSEKLLLEIKDDELIVNGDGNSQVNKMGYEEK